MLDSFQIIESVDSFYKLKLSETMHIHDVFHSELLHSAVDDSLSDQKNEFSRSIVINDVMMSSHQSSHHNLNLVSAILF